MALQYSFAPPQAPSSCAGEFLSPSFIPNTFSQWHELLACLRKMFLENLFAEVGLRCQRLLGSVVSCVRLRGIHPFQYAALHFYRALAEEAQARVQHYLNPSRLPRLQRAKADFKNGLSLIQGVNLVEPDKRSNLCKRQRRHLRAAASVTSSTSSVSDEETMSNRSISPPPSCYTDASHSHVAGGNFSIAGNGTEAITSINSQQCHSLLTTPTTIAAGLSTGSLSPTSTTVEYPPSSAFSSHTHIPSLLDTTDIHHYHHHPSHPYPSSRLCLNDASYLDPSSLAQQTSALAGRMRWHISETEECVRATVEARENRDTGVRPLGTRPSDEERRADIQVRLARIRRERREWEERKKGGDGDEKGRDGWREMVNTRTRFDPERTRRLCEVALAEL